MKKKVPATPSQRYSPIGSGAPPAPGAHRKAEAEAAVGAGKIEIVARDVRFRPDVIRCHQRDGLGFEVAPAVQRAAVQQHLRESRVVAHRPDHAGAAGFPAPRRIGSLIPAIGLIKRSFGIGSAISGRLAWSAT